MNNFENSRQTPSQVLHPILEHIYELANNGDFTGGNGGQPNKLDTTENAAMQVARATMVALNIIVQKQLKVRANFCYFSFEISTLSYD